MTSDSKVLAERMHNNENHNKYWWNLSDEEKQQWVDKAKARFEIKEFIERK
ncbi:hypothetical protein [Clostridium botulinum]|uniref:hypothetical protein n=1 Tax=Clostridium botulinum TaxID=1491 RepID=UPI0004AFA151|nr:hypothetical protein [Clostridium botulinum]